MNHLGFLVTLLGVGGAHALGSYGPLVGFLGVLVGASLIFAGVKTKTTTAGNPAAFRLPAAGAIASLTRLTALYLRHNLFVIGLLTAASAITAHVAGVGAGRPAVSFVVFVILLLGVAMVMLGVHGGLH